MYSRNGSPSWQQFTSFLVEGNRVWAANASALLVVLSKKDYKSGDSIKISGSHSFDTGSAWMSFTLQLNKMGWFTHGMAGIVTEKIISELKVPENFTVECMVAIGKIGDKKTLPEKLQSREEPNSRRPVKAFISEGKFSAEWTKFE
jgi:hypothetical protein